MYECVLVGMMDCRGVFVCIVCCVCSGSSAVYVLKAQMCISIGVPI